METQHNQNPQINTTQITGISANDLLKIINERIAQGIEEIKSHIAPPKPNQLMTRQEVASHFGVSLVTLNKWTKKGVLSSYRIGTKVRYKYTEVMEAMAEKEAKRING